MLPSSHPAHSLSLVHYPHLTSLSLVQRLCALIPTLAANIPDLTSVFLCIRVTLRIFYSLNVIDLPEFFEDNMAKWMNPMRALLQYDNPQIKPVKAEQPTPIVRVKSAISQVSGSFLSLLSLSRAHPFLLAFRKACKTSYSVVSHS